MLVHSTYYTRCSMFGTGRCWGNIHKEICAAVQIFYMYLAICSPFHSQSDVVVHLLFNIDVNIVLQNFIPVMQQYNTKETSSFLVKANHFAPRKKHDIALNTHICWWPNWMHQHHCGGVFCTGTGQWDQDDIALDTHICWWPNWMNQHHCGGVFCTGTGQCDQDISAPVRQWHHVPFFGICIRGKIWRHNVSILNEWQH